MNLNASIPAQKLMYWAGLLGAAVYGFSYIFLLDFLPPPSPTLDAAQVVDLYAHSNIKFRLGVFLMIVSGAFYLPMSLVIGIQMARIEKGFPVWAILQALASTVGAWIFAFPPVLWGVAAFTVSRAPEITRALHELAWLCFVTPSSFFSIQLIPLTIVSFTAIKGVAHSALPRWFGWFSIWAWFMMDIPPTLAQIFIRGPFAWDGLLAFWVTIILYLIWLITLSFLMLRSLSRQQQQAQPTVSWSSGSVPIA